MKASVTVRLQLSYLVLGYLPLNNWIAPGTAGKWGVSHLPDGIYGSWGGSFLSIPTNQLNKMKRGS